MSLTFRIMRMEHAILKEEAWRDRRDKLVDDDVFVQRSTKLSN